MFGANIDGSIILKEPLRLWQAFWILCGFRMIDFLLNMIISELKYKGGGEDFIQYGKKYVKEKIK